MAKKPIVFEDRKFNSKVEYTRYIRNYLNPLGVVELPKIKEEDISFFKEIAAKTNPDDLDEGSEIKIIKREGAKSNTIVVVNPNGKVKSLHWRQVIKPKKIGLDKNYISEKKIEELTDETAMKK